VRISDKLTGREVPLELNGPQRRVAAEMERMRTSGKPIRIILLKARQWGGSTLIQAYMAWMQLVVKRGWNSVLCAHVKDASATIRGMYSRLLSGYPEEMRAGAPESEWCLTPYEKSRDISRIAGRDCLVALATAASPDAVRGGSYMMAHLSEVAFWGREREDSGEQEREDDAARIVRTVCGSIPLAADTLVVMESTADGPRGFFYEEWQRAVAGKSDKLPIFVPWHEIEIYTREVKPEEVPGLAASLDEYERDLLRQGISLEKVAWYHYKRREYATHRQMMAEYPGSPEEAFSYSEAPLLDPVYTEHLTICPEAVFENMVPLMSATYGHTLCCVYEADASIVLRTIDARADTLRSILRQAEQLGAPLLLPEAPAERDCHAAWLARNADSEGVRLYYDMDGENRFALSRENLNMLVDNYADLMQWAVREGIKIVETDPEMQVLISTLRGPATNLLLHPALLCRLALLCCADRDLRQSATGP